MTRRVDLAMSVCPSVRLSVNRAETFPKVLYILQEVYKSEPAGSDNYIL